MNEISPKYLSGTGKVNSSRVWFVQISDQITNKDMRCREYYDRVHGREYNTVPPEHFMEVPTWIPVCAGYVSPGVYDRHVFVIRPGRIERFIALMNTSPDITLMFSVMDINKRVIYDIAKSVDNLCILGGYIGETDKEVFKMLPNVAWLESPAELKDLFISGNNDPDYSMFGGFKAIPRLQLSTGCKHACAFCSIAREVKSRSHMDVLSDAFMLTWLEFEYVYIDDKTFGQAMNYRSLALVYDFLKRYNSNLKGFIVQTTVPRALEMLQAGEIEELHIAAIECGVEVVDDEYLKLMRKPYRTKQLAPLMAELAKHNVKFIPNILLGFAGDDYKKTIKWLRKYRKQIAFVNPYILTLYDTAKGGLGYTSTDNSGVDQDETTVEKSWLADDEQKRLADALETILTMFE